MDPNATLTGIRELAKDIIMMNRAGRLPDDHVATMMVERFNDLDEWLTAAGLPPSDWWDAFNYSKGDDLGPE